jgi:hypothetical protein
MFLKSISLFVICIEAHDPGARVEPPDFFLDGFGANDLEDNIGVAALWAGGWRGLFESAGVTLQYVQIVVVGEWQIAMRADGLPATGITQYDSCSAASV